MGAGLAGLVTGAYLARDGFRVLLSKQNEEVGFTCQRFTLNIASSIIGWSYNRNLTFHRGGISVQRSF